MNETAARSTGRALALYALACVVIIGLCGGVFTVVFTTAAERQAVWVSAAVAFAVQMVAFAIARLLAEKGNGFAGWGLGAVICLLSLVVYGLLGRAFGLPPNAALISLATYYCLTELIEAPLLIG